MLFIKAAYALPRPTIHLLWLIFQTIANKQSNGHVWQDRLQQIRTSLVMYRVGGMVQKLLTC